MPTHLIAFSLPGTGTIQLPSQIQSISNVVKNTSYGGKLVQWGMNLAFTAAAVTALGFMLYGGWKWITSSGDAKNLETAHNIFIYASVGLGVVMLSAAFINVASIVFCVPLLGWIPPPPTCH